MSWHYLQGQEEASWAGTCLDGAPSALSSMIPTHEASSSPVNATDAFHDSRCGMTCEPSTGSHGEATLTSSQEDSHARTSPPQGRVPELMASDPGSGGRWRELWAKYDRVASGWKTHRCLWTEDLPWSSVTLPKWGMMQGGVLWERTTPEPRTSGTGVGFWRTPGATEANGGGQAGTTRLEQGHAMRLRDQVKDPTMWPTPRAGNPGSRPNGNGGKILAEEVEIAEGLREVGTQRFPTPTASMATMQDMEQARFAWNGGKRPDYAMFPTPCATEARQGFQDRSRGKKGSQESLSTFIQVSPAREAGGSLNPNWVEWLMGWPLGWTSTEPMPESTWAAWQQAFQSDPIASGASGTDRFRLPL